MSSALKFIVVSSAGSRTSDDAIVKLGSVLGMDAEVVPVASLGQGSRLVDLGMDASSLVLSVGLQTLRELRGMPWFSERLGKFHSILVYGFGPNNGGSAELAWSSSGTLTSIVTVPPGTRKVAIAQAIAGRRYPVSGQSFDASIAPAAGFAQGVTNPAWETLVSVNSHPYLAMGRRDATRVFLLAEESIGDIDDALAQHASLRERYGQLTALSLFFRSTFDRQCWTAPETLANFIIDDPLLRARYGFVEYDKLLPALEASSSSLCIAFIPFNFRRSDPRVVAMARHHSRRFSIAVHGCDHTAGELSLNEPWLESLAGCALQRMESHEKRYGIGFDNVMVFPQGRFSTVAMRALKRCGFLAAANSTAWAENVPDGRVTVREILEVAMMRYDSLPLFVRRYPKDLFEYAFDALFQKPVLGVEHHAYFRGGTDAFLRDVARISSLPFPIRWASLGEVVERSCVTRQLGGNAMALRHYTAALRFRNPGPGETLLKIEKAESSASVESVLVNGEPVEFEVRDGWVRYQARVAPGAELVSRVVVGIPARRPWSVSPKYRVKTAVRRVLSEARDNYLARNDGLLAAAVRLKSLVAGGKPKRDTSGCPD